MDLNTAWRLGDLCASALGAAINGQTQPWLRRLGHVNQ